MLVFKLKVKHKLSVYKCQNVNKTLSNALKLVFVCYDIVMKLIRTLKITSDEFYNYLETKLKEDILKHAKKKVSKIEKGVHYSIHATDRYARIDFKILNYERGKCYELEMKSYTDATVVRYDTKGVSEGLEVIFEQTINSEKDKKRNAITKKFAETVYLSQMSRTIYDIEANIIKNR